ncbi:MAG: hypothetical protein AAGA77_17300 [Bacteroidota bacterium]
MKYTLLLLAILLPAFCPAQNNELSIFDDIVGKRWYADGNWGDGSKFKQEISLNYALNNTIVLAESQGYIDEARTKFGRRNHGVRQYDKESGKVKFWEFDVFGGLTEGTVHREGKNIIYQYEYGGTFITDMWEYVDDSTYNFTVGSYENGVWKQVYLKTQFKEKK